VEVLVVTRGERGSTIMTRETEHDIPCAPPRRVADPTGVGDGYRAGFIAGMRYNLPWGVVGRMGSLAATYVLEEHGTQRHHYTVDSFIQRYAECFGDSASLEVLRREQWNRV
jgi:adenosine kinase